MNAGHTDFDRRLTCRVNEAAEALGVSERSMRRALEPGGDLAHLSLRVGHRQLVKVPALLALFGLERGTHG